jgi:hypothetical protein
MTEFNRQQICAALSVSESTIRRLEQLGLPFTPVGKRSKRYDLAECKAWLRDYYGRPADQAAKAPNARALSAATVAYTESYKRAKLRVMPSGS